MLLLAACILLHRYSHTHMVSGLTLWRQHALRGKWCPHNVILAQCFSAYIRIVSCGPFVSTTTYMAQVAFRLFLPLLHFHGLIERRSYFLLGLYVLEQVSMVLALTG